MYGPRGASTFVPLAARFRQPVCRGRAAPLECMDEASVATRALLGRKCKSAWPRGIDGASAVATRVVSIL